MTGMSMAVVDMSVHVEIDNASESGCVPSEILFLQWVSAALSGLRADAEVSIRIVSLQESAELNAHYRHKDTATNVLSFPSELPEDCDPPLLGDLAICAEVVEREACEQQKSPMSHWAHMVVHGTLHLLGFDHIQDDEAEAMESREIAVLAQLGFTNPYE
jgi:probable rRNA maturation factor